MPKRKESAGEGARPNPRPGMEQDFPRGGGGALSNVEVLQARQEAENEVREANGPAAKRQKKEKGKKRASEKVEGDESELLQGAVKGKLPKFVELLKFKVSTSTRAVVQCVTVVCLDKLLGFKQVHPYKRIPGLRKIFKEGGIFD
jgi:hypothetical protein